MKKILICMLLLIWFLTACGHSSISGDILFVNCTDVQVYSVRVNWGNETLVGQRADGAALGRYEYLTFDISDEPTTVTACGKDGTELTCCTILGKTRGQWSVQLTCDAQGKYTMKVKENESAAEKTVDLLQLLSVR